MSAADVTEITRKRSRPPGAVLVESDSDDFSTHHVLVGLHAVCCSLESIEFAQDMDIDHVHRLCMAARVLSAILVQREE